jgi:hypothetical protein
LYVYSHFIHPKGKSEKAPQTVLQPIEEEILSTVDPDEKVVNTWRTPEAELKAIERERAARSHKHAPVTIPSTTLQNITSMSESARPEVAV